MIQVLVKIGGKKKYRAKVHYYDAKRDRALCTQFVGGPNDLNWEIQERDVESFTQVEGACHRCDLKLRQLLNPLPARPPTALERRHAADLERLRRWKAQ